MVNVPLCCEGINTLRTAVMARLQLLGGMRAVTDGGAAIAFPTQKAAGLLAYLALQRGAPAPRASLATLLWGDRPDTEALAALRRTLYELRGALGAAAGEILRVERDRLGLRPEAVSVDVEDFSTAIAAGDFESLDRARGLYRGPFLLGLETGAADFDEWCGEQRTRLADAATQCLQSLAEQALDAKRLTLGLAAARQLISIDPLGEIGCRLLIRALAASGRRAEAFKAFETLCRALAVELQTTPELETCELVDRLRKSETAVPVASHDPPDGPSIVVLPFDNLTGDSGQEYLADGLTEDIITGLGRFRELFVIARNSSFSYKGRPVKVQEIGRDLGVQFVVEGSVRTAGSHLRVTAELVDVESGGHVWAERYDRVIEDVFAVQDEITITIIATVVGRVEARRISHTRKSGTSNMTAFDHVLHARHEIHYYTPESLAKARDHLTHAVALDPDYAAAHLSLSQAYWGEWWTGATPDPAGWFEHIFEHAERALRLDDADARVHLQIGFVNLYRRRYDEGRFHLEKALGLNPNEPNIPFCLAFLEVFEGNGGAAADWVNRSIRMDPLGHYGYILGQANYIARDYERSIAALQTVRPGMLSAGAWLAACHAQLGNQNEASEIMARSASLMSSAITDAGGKSPDSWCNYFAERWPFRHARDRDHLLDGFRMAGLT